MSDAMKPYDLIFEQKPEYLRAHVQSETITKDKAIAYLKEVIDKANELDLDRLLIERDIPQTLSDTDQFFTGTELASMNIKHIKIAFVDERAENIEPLGFAILVANNRGGQTNLFTSVPAAESWLLQGIAA